MALRLVPRAMLPGDATLNADSAWVLIELGMLYEAKVATGVKDPFITRFCVIFTIS